MSTVMDNSTDPEVTFKDHKSDSIRPEDSASQSTTSASWRIRAKAKRAALAAEVAALKDQQELEIEEMKLKQRKAELLLKTRLKIAEAEETVYGGTRSIEQKTEPSKSEPSIQQGSSTPVRTRMKPAGDNLTLTSQDEKITSKMDSDILQHLQQGQRQHQQLLEAITISSSNIMSFDGNPLNFFEFIRSFDSVIGNSSLDNNAKLLKLYHLCTGAAKDIIQCCLMMHQDDGYFHARTLLIDRFGSDHKISDAWIRKVTEGPVIQSNPKHLREFADQLKTCAETLMALGMLHEMSSRSELVKVIERLPFHLKSRWLRFVKTIRDSGRQPNIQHAVEFITGAADELNDPVFGALLMGGPKNLGSTRSVKERTVSGRGQASMFTTSVNSSTKNCIMCQDSHDLFGCQEFKAMEPDERFDFAFKNRLCFNCLLPGHVSSKCILNRTCSVKGCNQRHTKFLHTGRRMRPSSGNPTPWRARRESNDSSTQTDYDVASHASSSATRAGGCRVALPIIPVTVSAADGGESIETLALLDPGSTNSFCLQELIDVLQTKGKKKVIQVSTLESPKRAMECEAVKLRVKGSTADKTIEAEFLTRPSLNISTANMAREEDISKYQHLCGIDLPVTGKNQVTILIGQDVPEALMPLEIKAGKPGEVYAVKTLLGWTLNGPLGNGSSLQSFQASSSFISDDGNMLLEEQVHKFWKLEGTEYLHDDEKSMSINDQKALKTWQEGVCNYSDPEIKPPTENASAFTTQSEEKSLERLINTYSSWYKLRRGVSWLLKFMQWLKLKGKTQTEQELRDFKRISYDDMQKAEKRILHYVQKCFFQKEIESLIDSDGKVTKTSQLFKLDPKIDEGLVRVGGRLERSALPLEAKHPVVLPKGSHVSDLILRDVHVKAGHSGRNYVLSVLREKYWMLGAGAAIRSMISRCVMCRRQKGKMMTQKMADLPENRLLPDEPPFSKVGIDYFGPFEVKRGRSMEKRYGVMFTCLTTRAIHLEVAHSLDTDSCISAIRRFIARRGNIKEMLSDNGTNLVGAERELKREIDGWNKAQISADLLQKGIKWTFNPPTASHFGGVWERQIGTVRKLILAVTKQQVLSGESLTTLFCEIESIVNNRPLTRVSDDVNDLEALTPNHLLLLNRKPQLPPTVTDRSDVYSRRRWRQIQYLADVFWRRWSREYLPQLQRRERWVPSHRNLQIGDLVLVADANTPRNSWLLGRVLQTFPDKKGFTRSANIKTKNSVIVRPISKLCLILEGDC